MIAQQPRRNKVTQIITKNLLMRTLAKEDAPDLRDLLARNKNYMVPWIPWAAEEPQALEAKEEKIREWQLEFIADQKYTYGIFSNSSNELIGLIFLFTRQGKDKLEIGYIIDHNSTGKGYATEAGYALTKLGLHHVKIEYMVIHCNSKNVASAKIPEKLGYKLAEKKNEGADEMLIWSLSKKNFSVNEIFEPVQFVMKPSG